MQREHHFYVSVSKYLFQHPEHGVVPVQDPIRIEDAKQYDLSPIILYGLTIPGLPIRWMTFSPLDQPRAFLDVLQEAWNKAEGLRGRPDILRINRYLMKASPNLIQALARFGVLVEVADAKEKSLPASLRSAQDSSKNLLMFGSLRQNSSVKTIHKLCEDALYDHGSIVRSGGGGSGRRKDDEKIKNWLELPFQEFSLVGCEGVDWEVGSWLSSWESSVAPNMPRYFKYSQFDGMTWLLTKQGVPKGAGPNSPFWVGGGKDNLAAISKNLVACWPNSPAEIARCVGVTLRDLQWFFSGKAGLEQSVRFELEALLGIEFSERWGRMKRFPLMFLLPKNRTLLRKFVTLFLMVEMRVHVKLFPVKGWRIQAGGMYWSVRSGGLLVL